MREFKHAHLWPLIRQLDAAGVSTLKIAERLGRGWTKNMVIRQRREAGCPAKPNPMGSGNDGWSEAEVEALCRARADGKIWPVIATETGRSSEGCQRKYKTLVANGSVPAIAPMPRASVAVPAREMPSAATSVLVARPFTAAQLGSLGQRPPARAPRVTLKADAPPPTARDCQFILNDGYPWKFCARTDMAAGKSYCTSHAAICFRRVRDEREIADAA